MRAWVDASVLGKVLTACGILLATKPTAGLSDGLELLADRGWRKLIKGMTREDLAAAGERAARRFPGMVYAAELVRRSKRFRD